MSHCLFLSNFVIPVNAYQIVFIMKSCSSSSSGGGISLCLEANGVPKEIHTFPSGRMYGKVKFNYYSTTKLFEQNDTETICYWHSMCSVSYLIGFSSFFAFPYHFKYLTLFYVIDYWQRTWYPFSAFYLAHRHRVHSDNRICWENKQAIYVVLACSYLCTTSIRFFSSISSNVFFYIRYFSLWKLVGHFWYICIQHQTNFFDINIYPYPQFHISNTYATKWIEYHMNYKWFLIWPILHHSLIREPSKRTRIYVCASLC